MASKDSAVSAATSAQPITIKKYANRRLYNTATSSYVTLDHLAQMVRDGTDFVVYDAKTGEDITRSVLTHIIVEEEAKGQNLLPISFLRQLISLYGDSLQWMVPRYLEHSMQYFSRNQEQMRQYLQQAMSGMFPLGALEEMSKQNIAIFERAMKVFSPFSSLAAAFGSETDDGELARSAPAGNGLNPRADTDPSAGGNLDALQAKLGELQEQLKDMAKAVPADSDVETK